MKKKRDSLMIAVTLITGMTFQMAVNPPGGVWDEDKLTSAGAGTGTKMLLAGTSIMAYRHPEFYELFMAYNSMSFFGSLSMVFLVVSGVPFVKRRILIWLLMIIMWIILSFITGTYQISMMVISPANDHTIPKPQSNKVPDITKVVWTSSVAWFGLVGIVVLIHTSRFLAWCVRKLFWFVQKFMSCVGEMGNKQL